MSDSALPHKREVATAILGQGSLFLHLDPRVAGVEVPAALKQQPQLVLQVGLHMLIPIPDLRVDEHGVAGTLSFSRNPFLCVVPWESVFALVGDDGRGMVWAESMPPEIASEVNREAQRVKRAQAQKDGSPSAPRRLSSVPPPSAAEEERSVPDEPRVASLVGTAAAPAKQRPAPRPQASAPGKRRELPPYLRVVK
jgi:stringent starvation protein B